MTTIRQTTGVLLLSTLLSTGVMASTQSVIAWTKQTLLQTFSLNHETMDAQLKKAQSNYTLSAWSDLLSFFGDNTSTVRNYKLNLHPQLTGPAQIISSGDLDGVTYWKIVQPLSIPELKMNVSFAVVVIKADKPPFIIQSVNMTNL